MSRTKHLKRLNDLFHICNECPINVGEYNYLEECQGCEVMEEVSQIGKALDEELKERSKERPLYKERQRLLSQIVIDFDKEVIERIDKKIKDIQIGQTMWKPEDVVKVCNEYREKTDAQLGREMGKKNTQIASLRRSMRLPKRR